MPEIIPFYDIRLDPDGEPIIGPTGYQLINNVELIRQYTKSLILSEFNVRSYTGMTNEEATGDIIREDLVEILTNDVFLTGLNLTPIVDVYPTDNESVGFGLILTDGQTMTIDMGDLGFLNLRAGILVGYGEYELTNEAIYDFDDPIERWERHVIKSPQKMVKLLHKLRPEGSVTVVKKDDIASFAGDFPQLTSEVVTAEWEIPSRGATISLLNVFAEATGRKATSVTVKQENGTALDPSTYTLVNNYIVFDYDLLDYLGPIIITATLVDVATMMSKYEEIEGAYLARFATHERTNKEYRVYLSNELQPDEYIVIYQSYGVK